MVRFEVHPLQRTTKAAMVVEAEVYDEREVRSSSGHEEIRPFIRTTIEIGGQRWPIHLSLTRRDSMGFRMLLGRQALRGRVLVNPGTSFVLGGTSGHNRSRRRKEQDS